MSGPGEGLHAVLLRRVIFHQSQVVLALVAVGGAEDAVQLAPHGDELHDVLGHYLNDVGLDVVAVLEIGKLMALDALNREESCGGHFREEYQTEEGEAKRDDEHFMYVSCWKYQGEDKKPELLKEELKYEAIKVQQRNYKK